MAVSGAGNHIPRNSLARTVHTGRTSTDEIDGCGKGEARLLATGPFGPPPAPSRAPFGARKGPVLFSGAVGWRRGAALLSTAAAHRAGATPRERLFAALRTSGVGRRQPCSSTWTSRAGRRRTERSRTS